MSKGEKKKNIQIYGKLLCIHSKNKTNFLSSHFHFVRFTGTRIISSEIQVWERIYTPRFINSFPTILNRNKRNQNSQAPLTNFQTTGSNRDAANWGEKKKNAQNSDGPRIDQATFLSGRFILRAKPPPL